MSRPGVSAGKLNCCGRGGEEAVLATLEAHARAAALEKLLRPVLTSHIQVRWGRVTCAC